MQFIAMTQQYFGSDSILDHRSAHDGCFSQLSFLGVDKRRLGRVHSLWTNQGKHVQSRMLTDACQIDLQCIVHLLSSQ